MESAPVWRRLEFRTEPRVVDGLKLNHINLLKQRPEDVGEAALLSDLLINFNGSDGDLHPHLHLFVVGKSGHHLLPSSKLQHSVAPTDDLRPGVLEVGAANPLGESWVITDLFGGFRGAADVHAEKGGDGVVPQEADGEDGDVHGPERDTVLLKAANGGHEEAGVEEPRGEPPFPPLHRLADSAHPVAVHDSAYQEDGIGRRKVVVEKDAPRYLDHHTEHQHNHEDIKAVRHLTP